MLALAIACATWYVLTGERRERISERSYRIPLSIVNIPAGTLIVSPLPDAVDVRVRGAFTPLRQLEPSKLEAVIDLDDATPGEKRYALEPEDINVPRDVEVIAISPSEIRVVLDAVADKTVPIVPELTGQPAAGSRVEEVSVEPRQATASGPGEDARPHGSNQDRARLGRGPRRSVLAFRRRSRPRPPGVRVREGQLVTVRVRIRAAPEPTPTPTARPRRK